MKHVKVDYSKLLGFRLLKTDGSDTSAVNGDVTIGLKAGVKGVTPPPEGIPT